MPWSSRLFPSRLTVASENNDDVVDGEWTWNYASQPYARIWDPGPFDAINRTVLAESLLLLDFLSRTAR